MGEGVCGRARRGIGGGASRREEVCAVRSGVVGLGAGAMESRVM